MSCSAGAYSYVWDLQGLLTDKLGGDIGQCRFIHHVNLQRPDDGFYLGQEFSGPSPSADQQKNVSSGDQGNLVEGSMLLLLPSTLDTCDDSAALQNMQRAALDFVEQGAAQQQVLRKILQSSEAALRDAQAAMDEVNGIVHDDGIAVDTKESTPPSGGAKQEPTPRPQKIQATATPAPAPGPKTWANLAAKNGKNTAHSGGRGRGRGTNSGRGGNRGGREQPQTQTKSLKVDPSARKGRAQEISSDEPLPMVISAEARKKLETRLASAKRQFAKYRAQVRYSVQRSRSCTCCFCCIVSPRVHIAKSDGRISSHNVCLHRSSRQRCHACCRYRQRYPAHRGAIEAVGTSLNIARSDVQKERLCFEGNQAAMSCTRVWLILYDVLSSTAELPNIPAIYIHSPMDTLAGDGQSSTHGAAFLL